MSLAVYSYRVTQHLDTEGLQGREIGAWEKASVLQMSLPQVLRAFSQKWGPEQASKGWCLSVVKYTQMLE